MDGGEFLGKAGGNWSLKACVMLTLWGPFPYFAVNGLAPFFLGDFYKLVLGEIRGVTTQGETLTCFIQFAPRLLPGFAWAKEVYEGKYQDLSRFQHSQAALCLAVGKREGPCVLMVATGQHGSWNGEEKPEDRGFRLGEKWDGMMYLCKCPNAVQFMMLPFRSSHEKEILGMAQKPSCWRLLQYIYIF